MFHLSGSGWIGIVSMRGTSCGHLTVTWSETWTASACSCTAGVGAHSDLFDAGTLSTTCTFYLTLSLCLPDA